MHVCTEYDLTVKAQDWGAQVGGWNMESVSVNGVYVLWSVHPVGLLWTDCECICNVWSMSVLSMLWGGCVYICMGDRSTCVREAR